MSLKPCKITVTETGKVYDYEAIKEWLVENEALWKAPAKAEKAPSKTETGKTGPLSSVEATAKALEGVGNEYVSKIVDELSLPVTLYHWGKKGIQRFRPTSEMTMVTGEKRKANGIYFTADKELAQSYRQYKPNGELYEASVILKNPKKIKLNKDTAFVSDEDLKKYREEGHDGLIFEGKTGFDEVVVFDPESIIRNTDDLSSAYHAAKKDGSNPELVRAVEDLLAPTAPAAEGTGTEGKSILGSNVDLKGNKKEPRMMTFDEYFNVEKQNLPEDGKYAKEQIKRRHEEIIKNALEEKYVFGKKTNVTLRDDIEAGKINAQDVKTIIESAGLEVPKDILEKAKKDTRPSSEQKTPTEGKAPTGLDKLIQDAEQAIKDLKSDSSIGANKPLGILFLQTYIAVLKAAKAAGEVITAAQARLRARKQLIDQGNNPADVDAAMATASETLRKASATPPPPPVPPKAPQPEGQEGQVIKAVLGRSYTATTSEKVVKAIQDLGLFRPVVNIKDAFEKGEQLMEKLGFDGAYEVFQDLSKTFEGDGLYLGEDLRLGIFKALGEYLQKKIEKSDDAAQNDFDEKRLAVLQEKAYRLISGAGIRLRVWRDIMENTMVPYSYIKRKREWNTLFPNSPMPVELENKLKEAEARYNELSKKLLELEAKQKEWEESQAVSDIAESIEDENKTTKKPSTSVLKKLAQQVRKLSLTKPRPGMFNAATPASLAWDAAVEAVAKVLDAGGSVEIAVKKGVQVIKESDWYKKLSKAKQAQAEGQFVDYHSEILETKEGMAEVVNGVVEVPHSLIRYYVSEGETDIDVIAEKILDTLKEENPSLTKREVRDAISGYAKKVKRKTQNEINDTINTLKREGKLQSELEDLQRGIKKAKTPQEKKELSDRAKRIIEQIEQIHKDIFGYSRRQISDAERLQAYKDRARKRIDELKKKIAERDFSKKEKRPPVDYDAEAKEIEFEKFKLDEEWNDIVQEENKRVNGNALEKFLNIYGMTRWFTVGFDLGVAGIQGFLLSFQDLKATGMALRNAAKAMLLETNYEKIQSEIKNNPRYKLARESGLDFYNRNDTIANKDDLAAISSASTAFNTFGVFLSKMAGKREAEFYRIWKALNPFTALERTQAAYMNTLQFAMFNAVADIAEMKGYDFKEDPQVFKDAADITNTFSRRTKMAGLEKNKAFMAAMNVGFFSARNWASLIKLTTPILFYHLGRRRAGADTWNSLSPVQKVALKTYAKAVLSTFAVVLLAKLLGGWDNDELDEEEKKKEGVVSVNIDDARRADWMKIRIGKQTIDPFSGLSQHIILQTRLIADMLFGMRGYVSTETGIEKYLGQDNVPSPLGLIGRMAEGKLQPTTRLLYTGLASRRVKGQPAYIRSMYLTGQEVDLRQEAKEAITNLTVKAGQESYEEQGGFFGTLFTALAIFGFGVSRDQAIEEQSIKRQIQQKLSPDKEKQMWEKAFKSYARENDKEMANKAFEKAVKGEEKYKKAKEIIREVSGDNIPKRYGLKEDDIPLLFERLKTGKAVSSPALNALTIDELDRIRNDYKVQYKELMSLVGIIEAMDIKNKYNERINWTEKVNFTPWVKEYQMAIGGK